MLPNKLKKGDLIRIVCPSGYLNLEITNKVKDVLEKWGYRVQLGSTVGLGTGYFAGSDEDRKVDLQLALDDPEVKAVFMGRGGYGMSKIIDDIDFEYFSKNSKWLVGFSDITVLLNHVNKHFDVATIHGPMAMQFHDAQTYSANKALWNLLKIFNHDWEGYRCKQVHDLNKWGWGQGVLVGGNLSLLTHMIGTASAIDYQDKILFIEDIGEYLYGVDRHLMQLERMGVFDQINGLIIGQFSNIRDTVRPFGRDLPQIIYQYVKDRAIPVYYDFPAGHDEVNYPLIMGENYSMQVSGDGLQLTLHTSLTT